MTTSIVPADADLWPKAYPVTSYRPPGGRLTLEIPGLSEAPLLTALSHAIHIEMRAAGEWAARIGQPGEKGPFGPKAFCRLRTDTATRLLAIYTEIYGCASYRSDLDLTPEAVKASASRSYAKALHAEKSLDPDKPLSPPSIPTSRRN